MEKNDYIINIMDNNNNKVNSELIEKNYEIE